MAAYSYAFVISLVFLNTLASHHDPNKHHTRQLWDLITDKLADIFSNDDRRINEHDLILFSDVAFKSLNITRTWTVIVHGWRYQNNKRKSWFQVSVSLWIKRLKQNLFGQNNNLQLDRSINHDRLRTFFVSDESNKMVQIKIRDTVHSVLTDKYGQFRDEIEINDDDIEKLKQYDQDGAIIYYEASTGDIQTKTGIVRLIEPNHSISIISDIDDTIKISEVLDKIRLFANTFVLPFKPVPGMSELYRQWQKNKEHCTFHYLSGMPDQLYTLTRKFIRTNNFPDGSFHMRHFGWPIAYLLDFLRSESTFNHKMHYLRLFLLNTRRTYVLVGDSGEKDPEIYGTIAREYPERIRAIFIRAVKGESFDHRRFVKAFAGIPNEKWLVFNDSKQVPTDLSQALVKTNSR